MLYYTDCYENDTELELTMRAGELLQRLALPTPLEIKVIGRAKILAYCEKVDAVHFRHIKQAFADIQKEELDNLAENTENHNAITA